MRRNPTVPLKEEVKYGHGFFRGEKCPLSGEDGVLVMSPRHLDQFGRVMAGVLRHFPDRFDLEMDKQGWIEASEFIDAVKSQRRHFHYLETKHLQAVVETDPKGRYQLKNGRLRATYAHTLDLDLDLPTDKNPEHLYFACSKDDSIEYIEHGLYPGDRNMVHLSSTRLNALEAGRHIIGKPIVLLVDVRAAEEADCAIMKAGTTVYLVKELPGDFLKKLPDST
jgi:putative RNA 2'-phosphotransferase|tara:strand:+ start:2795 stop:3463 length:669 start_codon:yes stop_codon:yes gene_type:complete